MRNENHANIEHINSDEPQQKKQSDETVKRPILLSILCILGFFGVAINSLQYVSNMSGLGSLHGEWFPIAMFFMIAIKLVGLIGLWNMRAWGVYIFTFSILLDIVMSMIMGIEAFAFILLIVPILMIVYGFTLIAKGQMKKGFFPDEEGEISEEVEDE